MCKPQRRRGICLFGVLLSLALLASVACTTQERERLEGLLQNVDAVNGEITVVTKDGKTIKLKIATEAPVTAEGTSSTLEALVPGTNVQVDLDKKTQVVREVKARLAEVEGRIVTIEGDKVTIETERGRKVTVTVTERTRVELDDDLPGTLADLKVGMEAEVRYDPDSGAALQFETEEEEVEIEGAIIEITGKDVTLETEKGRRITVIVEDRTRIELDDVPGKLSDLKRGMEIEVTFDPFSRQAFNIKTEDGEATAEVEGTIVEVKGNEVTIQTEKGLTHTVSITDLTRIRLEDNLPGTLQDLLKGVQIKVNLTQAPILLFV